jgi:hypothetical protein
MDKEIFRYMLRKVYKITEPTNDECDEICAGFTAYLNKKCTPEQLEKFLPRTIMQVILKAEHPLKTEGFHPALILHFSEYVRQSVEGEKPCDTL